MLGNGGLTVGLSNSGVVRTCRWPSPGYYDQIAIQNTQRDAQATGLQWGIRIGEGIIWMSDPAWESEYYFPDGSIGAVTLTSRLPGFALAVRQEIVVHPEDDVLTVHIEVQGANANALLWYANPNPNTRLVPEWPIADWLFPGNTDFACFASDDDRAVIHFRPQAFTTEDYNHAVNLLARRAYASEWKRLGSGAWIAYRLDAQTKGLHCGREDTAGSAWAMANGKGTFGSRAAVGASDSMIKVKPSPQDGLLSATAFVVFADTAEGASNLVDQASARGFVSPNASINGSDDVVRAALDASLRVLRLARDRKSGAIVEQPAGQPSRALDRPRFGAWTTMALLRAGDRDAATEHVTFYLNAVRSDDAPGRPAGSMPTGLYADGTAGSPAIILEVEGAAHLLWSAVAVLESMSGAERTAFLDEHWDGLALAASFLAGWTDVSSGVPLPAFNPQMMRDTSGSAQHASVYLGMASGVRLGQLAREEPETATWSERLLELEPMLERRHAALLSARLGEWAPAGLGKETVPEEQATDFFAGLKGAHAFYEAVVLSREDSPRREQLRQSILAVLKNQPSNGNNAVVAALWYLGLSELFNVR